MTENEYLRLALACERTLYRVARSILWNDQDAADAVSEAVFKGWAHRGKLRNAEKFRAWLTRILINECRNLQRRLLNQKLAQQALSVKPAGVSDIGLYEAMAKLSGDYRLLLTLHHAEGYSISEIAKMTGKRENLIKSRLFQARRTLERLIAEGAEE